MLDFRMTARHRCRGFSLVCARTRADRDARPAQFWPLRLQNKSAPPTGDRRGCHRILHCSSEQRRQTSPSLALRWRGLRRIDSLIVAGRNLFQRSIRLHANTESEFRCPLYTQIRPARRQDSGRPSKSRSMIGGWDNMDHDRELLSELKKEATLRRRQRLARRTINNSTTPKIEMVVSCWYADEFGNQTRTVMACD